MARYVPKLGDVVWIDFNPQSGHEQAGRRPALVLSATEYNRKVGLMICCPLTNQVKGYPFEVPLEGTAEVSGFALADQIKSLDWRARNAKKKARAPKGVLAEAIAKTNALLRIEH